MKALSFIFIATLISIVLLYQLNISAESTQQIPLHPVATQPKVKLTFGVVPRHSLNVLARLWNPVRQHLRQQGYDIQLRTASNIVTFTEQIHQGEYDLIFTNPYHYLQAHEIQGYRVFVKPKKKHLQGIIVVHNASTVQAIRDLDGQALLFPKGAFAANLIPRMSLKNQNILYKEAFTNSHDDVYNAVAQHTYVAGGGVVGSFLNTDPTTQAQLRILWKSPAYPPHSLAAHPRIAPEIVQAMTALLVEMDNSPALKRSLNAVNMRGFEVADHAEWEQLIPLFAQLAQ